MKQVIYCNNKNANKAFEQELWELAQKHKIGDRISVSLHYAQKNNNKALLSIAQLRSALADLYNEKIYIIPLSSLNSGASSKVVFQLTDKEGFESLYTVKKFEEKIKSSPKNEESKSSPISISEELINQLLEKDRKNTDKGATDKQRLEMLLNGLKELLSD